MMRKNERVTGYFEHTLRKDPRYRLSTALSKQGVLDTSAGRAAHTHFAPSVAAVGRTGALHSEVRL